METPQRKPRRGDRLEVDLDGLDARGRAVGRGTAAGVEYGVRMRFAVPGSRVVADVGRRSKGLLEARVDAVLDPGPHTREPACPHFTNCGGCSFQTTDYNVQLREKRRMVAEALATAGIESAVEPVVGSEGPWAYRNKMDFTFSNRRWIEPGEAGGAPRDFALGLHVPGRHEKVLDIRACAIQFAGADEILSSVRMLAREQGLEPWDNQTHTGLLRHLVLRKGVRTGEVMIDLVTSEDAPERIEPFAAALVERHPEITTFVQNINTRAASIAVGEREHVLFGPGVIRERLLDLVFTISANSFFQTNTVQAERLFEIVREEARCSADDVVYDLYCGAGTIGLALATSAREVWGFESVEPAVADARLNAQVNGLRNATFLQGDVLALLSEPEADARPRADLCILDPPRAGLHPKVPQAVLDLAPDRILYVSCNIVAAARDLPMFLAAGYRLTRVRPVDLFPHTPHVECVLSLSRAV